MEDYKIRMIQEYRELKERLMKLRRILLLNDVGKPDFVLTCPIYILSRQKDAMATYLECLEDRAILEDVDLEADIDISWESECAAEKRPGKLVFHDNGTVTGP